jgi:hypothetical protein
MLFIYWGLVSIGSDIVPPLSVCLHVQALDRHTYMLSDIVPPRPIFTEATNNVPNRVYDTRQSEKGKMHAGAASSEKARYTGTNHTTTVASPKHRTSHYFTCWG